MMTVEEAFIIVMEKKKDIIEVWNEDKSIMWDASRNAYVVREPSSDGEDLIEHEFKESELSNAVTYFLEITKGTRISRTDFEVENELPGPLTSRQ